MLAEITETARTISEVTAAARDEIVALQQTAKHMRTALNNAGCLLFTIAAGEIAGACRSDSLSLGGAAGLSERESRNWSALQQATSLRECRPARPPLDLYNRLSGSPLIFRLIFLVGSLLWG